MKFATHPLVPMAAFLLGSGCSGDDAVSSIVVTATEAAGENCAAGGLKVEVGADDNGNGILDADEVESTDYVCSGVDGTAGQETLITTSLEEAGANCADGGQRIAFGIDDNADGVLDPDEVDGTTFVCDGSDGLQSLVSLVPLAANFTCPQGGQTVNHGVDDDGNGILDVGEIDGTTDVCVGGCQGAPFIVTKNFANRGTFVSAELDEGDVTIVGAPGNINVLNLNGLGVVGGTGDSIVDDGESLTYTFNRPAAAVSYFVPAAGNGNGNGVAGESSMEAFGLDNASLGSVNVAGSGSIEVSSAFGDVPISQFRVTLVGDNHRVGSLTFTTCN